jgi:ribosomal-protein-alanine N-acetyltransferase
MTIPTDNSHISLLSNRSDAEVCANAMAESEPWLTLGRNRMQSQSLINHPSSRVYLLHQADTLCGFLVVKTEGPFSSYIQTLFIFEKHRGSGLGTLFLKRAEEFLFKEHPNVFICCSSFNIRALSLYQKVGYEVIGELKEYIVKGYSEILLRKTIGPISEFNSK